MPPRNSVPTDIWDKFRVALITADEKRPPDNKGWLTFSEMIVRLKICKGKLRKIMRNNRNAFDSFEGLVLKNGRLVRAVWYRPI